MHFGWLCYLGNRSSWPRLIRCDWPVFKLHGGFRIELEIDMLEYLDQLGLAHGNRSEKTDERPLWSVEHALDAAREEVHRQLTGIQPELIVDCVFQDTLDRRGVLLEALADVDQTTAIDGSPSPFDHDHMTAWDIQLEILAQLLNHLGLHHVEIPV